MDTVLTNGQLVDGTGADPVHADVWVSDGRIKAVGDRSTWPAPSGDVVDLDGLVLAPGFIDVHTHYDAQVFWDPALTPSTWHGVTSVVMGNCGFSLAPVRAEHREKLLRTLENVEAMSFPALSEGVSWGYESFPEYLDLLEAMPLKCNVGVLVGHTPVRLYVMGEDAVRRESTPSELAEMSRLVTEALRAGAVGFASGKTDVHIGEGGGPVPSMVASNEEIAHLARLVTTVGHGVFQVAWGPDFALSDCLEVAEAIRPHTVAPSAIFDQFFQPLRGLTPTETLRQLDASGLDNCWPQVSCRPVVFQLSLEDPMTLAQGGRTAFQEIMGMPRDQRAARYRDSEWRARARVQFGPEWEARWERTTIQETTVHTAIQNGPSIGQLARERNIDPMDLVLDLALQDEMATRFQIVLFNYDDDAVGDLLTHPQTLISLSDAGAHMSQLCDANFATVLLEKWVRKRGLLSLSEGVHQLTGLPARLYGLHDRGVIRVGAVADLVAFDADTIGSTDLERVWDQPAGADRLIARSTGIEHIWVNGTATTANGQPVEAAAPGQVIRGH